MRDELSSLNHIVRFRSIIRKRRKRSSAQPRLMNAEANLILDSWRLATRGRSCGPARFAPHADFILFKESIGVRVRGNLVVRCYG